MPLAQVAPWRHAERSTNRAPHPVGGDEPSRVSRGSVIEGDGYTARVLLEVDEGQTFDHVDSDRTCALHECVVEVESWHHGREATVGRKWNEDFPTRWGSEPGAVHVEPIRDRGGVESEVVEVSKREGRQTVTATLVAWKTGFVDEGDREAGFRRRDGGGRSGWSGPDDQDITRGRSSRGHVVRLRELFDWCSTRAHFL